MSVFSQELTRTHSLERLVSSNLKPSIFWRKYRPVKRVNKSASDMLILILKQCDWTVITEQVRDLFDSPVNTPIPNGHV